MSARSKALAYSAQVKERNSSRIQPDPFGKPKATRSAPDFAEHPRANLDNTADETKSIRNEVDRIAEREHHDETDSNSFNKGKPSGNVIVPIKTTSGNAVSEPELRSAFAKSWTIVSDINIPPVFHDEKSFFHPLMFNIFEVLFELESNMVQNEELKWICPQFFSLTVRVYYAVLAIVCVYRAKEQAGMISKSEGSWLRAFDRRFKDAQCPIAGPLVPILTNIAAVLPDDNQFDYVYPTIKSTGTYSTKSEPNEKKSTVIVDPTHFFTPSVPLIADMLKQFCLHPRITDDMFDEQGNYVPFNLATGGTLGGVHFPPVTATNPIGATFAQLLHNPVLMRPLPESKARMKEIHPFFKRSRARNFPSPNPTEFNPTQPSDFTGIGESMDWFQICLDQAVIMSKFFKDSTNLSAIHPIGGQSVTVQSELTLSSEHSSIPMTLTHWYPDVFTDLKAKFRSTNATLDPDHAFQASYCLTNGKLPWLDTNGKKIGSRASGLRGGPYWDNVKYNHQLDHPTRVNTNLYTMIQTQFYDAKASH